jgi:hypothetical protein
MNTPNKTNIEYFGNAFAAQLLSIEINRLKILTLETFESFTSATPGLESISSVVNRVK